MHTVWNLIQQRPKWEDLIIEDAGTVVVYRNPRNKREKFVLNKSLCGGRKFLAF